MFRELFNPLFKGNKVPDVREACTRTKSNLNKKYVYRLERTNNSIKSAIEKGQFKVIVDIEDWDCDLIMDHYTAYGYFVKRMPYGCIEISWKIKEPSIENADTLETPTSSFCEQSNETPPIWPR